MPPARPTRIRTALIWSALTAAIAIPIAAAAASPQLEYRDPIYIAAGFAGIAALAILLIQPLLISSVLPGLSLLRRRKAHRWTGAALVATLLLHVAGLWITSPPDMLDALSFASPTPFSPFGVIAMWAIFATAILSIFRRRLRLHIWRLAHMPLAVVIVVGGVVHAMLIEGTMETASKSALCALVLVATIKLMLEMREWRRRGTLRADTPQH